jgi:hypothetical protein
MAPAIPPSLLAPGDLQSTGIASGSPGLWREAIIWHKGTIAQALTLPALLNFTLVQDPLTAAVTAQWTAIPGAKHHSLTLVQPDSDIPLEIQVEATAGWIGTGPTVTYVLPVVPGISGLQTFDRKASIEWRITASAASFGLAPPDLPQPFQEGDWAWFSGARGTRPAASAGIDAPSHAPAELNRPKWFGRFN